MKAGPRKNESQIPKDLGKIKAKYEKKTKFANWKDQFFYIFGCSMSQNLKTMLTKK